MSKITDTLSTIEELFMHQHTTTEELPQGYIVRATGKI
jgi:hypothetical protein